jgi:hypothetical protein
LAATRPPAANWPAPVAPPVSMNQGRCAGAFSSVRTQIFSLVASVLSCSINSRALTGACADPGLTFVATVMTFAPACCVGVVISSSNARHPTCCFDQDQKSILRYACLL